MDKLPFNFSIKSLDEQGVFEGYASTFGNKDQGGDIVLPGAFKASIKAKGARGIKMLADHDTRQRIGYWTSIDEDEKGLRVSGRLFLEKSIGQDAYIDLKAGQLDGLSIGGRTMSDGVDGRKRARLIKEFDLFEISLVPFPMNEAARTDVVKSATRITTIREFEDFLRDEGGFSHAAAKSIAAGGWKTKTDAEPRDEDGPDIEAIKKRFRALAA